MSEDNEKKSNGPINKMRALALMRGDIPPIVVHEGVSLPWVVSTRAVKAIKEYEIRNDDVWIITYPKSGTHWATEIVNLVLANGDEEKIDRKKQPRALEHDMTQPGATIPPNFPPEMVVPLFERCKSWPSPRVFMSHLHEHMLPQQIHEGNGKVIFVMRNPKDVSVSQWHFLRPSGLNPKYEQWDTFLELCLTEDIPYGTWFTHTLNYWKKHRHDKNFLFLTYEDIKQDPRGAVVKVANHLERPLSDEVIDRIVKLSAVDSMKKRFTTTEDSTSGKPKMGVPNLIRKGMVGDWKTQFTVAQNEAYDKIYHERMEGSDLHIDFELC